MSPAGQQEGRIRPGLTAAVALAAAIASGACDSPARVKPWRHAPDPADEASRAPRSAALAQDEAGVAIRGQRAHTLRIHVDAEVRALNPLVSPSLWTRRIAVGPVF